MMTAATAAYPSAPFATLERDGMTLIYDTPTRTVFVAALRPGRCLVFAAISLLATIPLWLDAAGFAFGYYGAIAMGIAAVATAIRHGRLETVDGAWWRVIRPGLTAYLLAVGGLLVAQWLAHVLDRVWALGFLTRWGYIIYATIAAGSLLAQKPSQMAEAMGQEIPALPRILLPIDQLRARRARLQTGQNRLLAPLVFDADDAALAVAWSQRNTAEIERRLHAGDALNRNTWQEAIDLFNAARDDIDVARGRLRQLVREAETALTDYIIDEAALTIDRSLAMEGQMVRAELPAGGFLQKLDYGRGVGMAAARLVTGNGPWQLSAAALVFSGVMLAINHQQRLRQLKELEGQIKAQAQAARSDARLIGDMLFQRMLPQFDGLLAVIARLETDLQALRLAETAHTDEPKARAFQLACTFHQAQYLLEMKAGN